MFYTSEKFLSVMVAGFIAGCFLLTIDLLRALRALAAPKQA
jgi:hypothetical protein